MDDIRDIIGHEIEGVGTAAEAQRLADRYQVDMPIVHQVYSVLYEGLSPEDAVKRLLARDTRVE